MMRIAPQIDHHFAGHLCRDQRTVISFDESQRHVDAGSNSSTADDAPILDEKTVCENLCAGAKYLKFRSTLPVRSASAVLQQTGLSKGKSARTDRADPCASAVGRFEPLD